MTVAGAAIIITGACIAMIGLNELIRRRAFTAMPPARPEWVREQFEKEPLRGPVGHAVLAGFILPPIVAGALLMALADGDLGRQVGAVLVGSGVGLVAAGIWNARPARKQRYQERVLAHSETFWSRPGAEEYARRIR